MPIQPATMAASCNGVLVVVQKEFGLVYDGSHRDLRRDDCFRQCEVPSLASPSSGLRYRLVTGSFPFNTLTVQFRAKLQHYSLLQKAESYIAVPKFSTASITTTCCHVCCLSFLVVSYAISGLLRFISPGGVLFHFQAY